MEWGVLDRGVGISITRLGQITTIGQVLTKAPGLLESDPEGALTAIVSGREVEATESSGGESEESRASDDSGGG